MNHTSGTAKRGVAGVYNRALYLSGRREALLSWADHIYGLNHPRLDASMAG